MEQFKEENLSKIYDLFIDRENMDIIHNIMALNYVPDSGREKYDYLSSLYDVYEIGSYSDYKNFFLVIEENGIVRPNKDILKNLNKETSYDEIEEQYDNIENNEKLFENLLKYSAGVSDMYESSKTLDKQAFIDKYKGQIFRYIGKPAKSYPDEESIYNAKEAFKYLDHPKTNAPKVVKKVFQDPYLSKELLGVLGGKSRRKKRKNNNKNKKTNKSTKRKHRRTRRK